MICYFHVTPTLPIGSARTFYLFLFCLNDCSDFPHIYRFCTVEISPRNIATVSVEIVEVLVRRDGIRDLISFNALLREQTKL